MRYGYVRVSTEDQNVERQLLKMQELGIGRSEVFVDKASGKDMERPEWQRLMSLIAEGDQIVVDSLDRLGRDYEALTFEWRRITREVGCDVKALDLEFFDSAAFREMGDVGRCVEDMLLSLLAYVAQTERKKMLSRQAEGIAVAKAEGRYQGRRPIDFDEEALAKVREHLGSGGSKASAARMLGVSRATLYRALDSGRLAG